MNNHNNTTQLLISEVQLFRIRVATAESELKVIREHAREAKRHRKEAKRIGRQARRQFKESKAELAELKEALAKAKTELVRAGGHAPARKVPKPVTKASARPSKKAKAAARRLGNASRAVAHPPGRVRGKMPAIKQAVPERRANVNAH